MLNLADLEGGESFDPSWLGQAEEVGQERIADEELLIIRVWQLSPTTCALVAYIAFLCYLFRAARPRGPLRSSSVARTPPCWTRWKGAVAPETVTTMQAILKCCSCLRSLHDAICIIKRTLESKAVVPGGGAVEAALSIYLEEFAHTLGSREQLAIAEFAEALLIVPKVLAVNAAQDSTDLVAQLRAYHNSAQTPNGKKEYSMYVCG